MKTILWHAQAVLDMERRKNCAPIVTIETVNGSGEWVLLSVKEDALMVEKEGGGPIFFINIAHVVSFASVR